MTHIRHITLLLLVVALLAGCRKEYHISAATDGRIFFNTDILDVNIGTRASVVTSSSLDASGIYVSATSGSAGSETSLWTSTAFTKTGSYFDGGRYWDESNPGYHFYSANTPLTFSAVGTTVSASNTTDVVCEYLASPTFKELNTLSFDHIFARIGNVTVSAADGYTITNVHMSITPYTGGTYNLRTGSGQSDGTGWSALVSGSATELANTTPGTKANDLYLVPGLYEITLNWTATKGAYSKDVGKTFNNVAITGGRVNDITVSLTGNASAVELGVNVRAWSGNAITMGDITPIEPRFGGILIAQGNLYWDGSSWSIDEAWNSHSTFESSYGVNSGIASSYFSFVELGKLFERTGFTKSDGHIENCLNPLDGWRLPSRFELETIFSTSTDDRPGSTVNGHANIHQAFIRLATSVSYINIDGPYGILVFPDNLTINGLYLVGMDAGKVTYNVTLSQLNNYLQKGCVFFPQAGALDYDGFSWYNDLHCYWSSTQWDSGQSYVLYLDNDSYDIDCDEWYKEFHFPVRLVK